MSQWWEWHLQPIWLSNSLKHIYDVRVPDKHVVNDMRQTKNGCVWVVFVSLAVVSLCFSSNVCFLWIIRAFACQLYWYSLNCFYLDAYLSFLFALLTQNTVCNLCVRNTLYLCFSYSVFLDIYFISRLLVVSLVFYFSLSTCYSRCCCCCCCCYDGYCCVFRSWFHNWTIFTRAIFYSGEQPNTKQVLYQAAIFVFDSIVSWLYKQIFICNVDIYIK